MKRFYVYPLLSIIFLLTACSNQQTGQNNQEDATTIQVSSGGELSTLDSSHYTDVYSSDMIGQVMEGLYRLDKQNNPELAMAKAEPTVSEDGLVYTFQLREAKWSNGDLVNAKDFVYSFKNVVDPSYGSSSSNQMDIFKNGRKIREGKATLDDFGVKALDDQTLQLTLETPIPYLSQILVGTPFMPKNEKFAESKGETYGISSENFVGNGPFLLEGWDGTTESWQLVKNPTYWDKDNVKLERIDVQVIKEIGTGVGLFETGDLDYTAIADTYAFEYRDAKEAHFVPKATVGYLGVNQSRELTSNVHLRKAILSAIDKEGFVKDILGDGSTALNGFIPKDFAKNPTTGEDFREENGDLLPYDLEAAKKYWAIAQQELGKKEMTLELISADSALAKKTIEFIQGQVQQNLPGLTLTLKSLPLQNRLDLQTAGDYDLAFGTWTPDYADPINFLEFYDSKSGLNTARYNNPAYDQGLVEARTTLANDPQARWEKLLALEKMLVEQDAGVLPFYQGANAYLKSDRLQDVQIFPFGRTISYRLAYAE